MTGRLCLGRWVLPAMPLVALAQTPFSHRGIDAIHPGSSVLPNEQMDPASGNLAVVATDLLLPGNAGLDLRVTRICNRAVYPDYINGSTSWLSQPVSRLDERIPTHTSILTSELIGADLRGIHLLVWNNRQYVTRVSDLGEPGSLEFV